MPAPISKKKREAMICAYLDGATIKEAAESYGCSRDTCRKALRLAGVEIREKVPREACDEMVRLYLEGATVLEAASAVGYGATACTSALTKAGVQLRGGRLSNELRGAMVSDYIEGMSMAAIARKYSRSSAAVEKALSRAGLDKREHVSTVRHNYNKDFFAAINDEKRAYWLGFIAADGCITSGVLCIGLQESDHAHLEKFKRDIEYSGPVKHYKVSTKHSESLTCRISIKSPEIISGLTKAGITERKSCVCPAWKGPKNLMRHYWRGVIDGDGCIFRTPDGCFSVGMIGSMDMVSAFAALIESKTGRKLAIVPHGNVYTVTLYQKEAVLKVLSILYDDCSVFLDRKKKLAEEAKGWRENPRSKLRERKQEIRALYEGGASLPELACKFDTSHTLIQKRIVEAGGVLRDARQAQKNFAARVKSGSITRESDIKRQEFDRIVLTEYEAGASTVEIAKCYNLTSTGVGSMIRRAGGTIRTASECRNLRFQKSGSTKLAASDVREIRKRIEQGEKNLSIARAYKVTSSTISQIKTGKSWRHLPKD